MSNINAKFLHTIGVTTFLQDFYQFFSFFGKNNLTESIGGLCGIKSSIGGFL
ncbi:hypothetical protein BTU51_0892 [Rickettsia rickettsii]|uniref:Uncharacterized protein n=1 Tax=Rickettsia rickettsii (strain Iowa) TaxID=452659 RepID=B0BXZ4_RICRO|nr:hypothetical protein [Rickettsia rickettsii]ABY72720.1 hypothetical protein RrIowa_0892 [Rickettsia rickettsii str. Iowa]APU55670.1 hypothetical protein BTU50_0892 [Rickettsia rickettsii]APU57047.1 hypothetical protein BTU51_0892 [Rickettsia rickettsii]